MIADAGPEAIALLLPAGAAGIAAAYGAKALAPDLPARRGLLIGCALVTAVVVALLATDRGDGVSGGRFVQGLAIGAALLGVLPPLVYFGLGRLLARHRRVLVAVCVVSLAGLFYYVFIALLVTLDYVYCPPDAYECPV